MQKRDTIIFPRPEQILADRKAGMTVKQMVVAYDISLHHLTNYMRANGLTQGVPLMELDDEQITKDLHAGLKLADIAAKFDISQATLHSYMTRKRIRTADVRDGYADLHNPTKITLLRKVFDPESGITRVRRTSLAPVSLLIAAAKDGQVRAEA